MPAPGELPAAVNEVTAALKKQGFETQLDTPDWGSWIQLKGLRSVIAIDLERRLVSRATLEIDDTDPVDTQQRLFTAFGSLGWQGEDEDGPFSLD